MEVEIHRHSPEAPWTYRALDQHQYEVLRGIEMGEKGRFLLSELAPVVTLGRRETGSSLLFSPDEFSSNGIEILETGRGGLATYHGPGQWVVFPVARLGELTGDPHGVRKAVDWMLAAAACVARQYRSGVEIRQDAQLGVWDRVGKIASVGLKIERGVVLHGLAVNCFRTPTSFVGIRPCGLDAAVSFLLKDGLDLGVRESLFVAIGEKLVTNLRENML